ncbi:unnamed protein product [Diplocarpon coronariae]
MPGAALVLVVARSPDGHAAGPAWVSRGARELPGCPLRSSPRPVVMSESLIAGRGPVPLARFGKRVSYSASGPAASGPSGRPMTTDLCGAPSGHSRPQGNDTVRGPHRTTAVGAESMALTVEMDLVVVRELPILSPAPSSETPGTRQGGRDGPVQAEGQPSWPEAPQRPIRRRSSSRSARESEGILYRAGECESAWLQPDVACCMLHVTEHPRTHEVEMSLIKSQGVPHQPAPIVPVVSAAYIPIPTTPSGARVSLVDVADAARLVANRERDTRHPLPPGRASSPSDPTRAWPVVLVLEAPAHEHSDILHPRWAGEAVWPTLCVSRHLSLACAAPCERDPKYISTDTYESDGKMSPPCYAGLGTPRSRDLVFPWTSTGQDEDRIGNFRGEKRGEERRGEKRRGEERRGEERRGRGKEQPANRPGARSHIYKGQIPTRIQRRFSHFPLTPRDDDDAPAEPRTSPPKMRSVRACALALLAAVASAGAVIRFSNERMGTYGNVTIPLNGRITRIRPLLAGSSIHGERGIWANTCSLQGNFTNVACELTVPASFYSPQITLYLDEDRNSIRLGSFDSPLNIALTTAKCMYSERIGPP